VIRDSLLLYASSVGPRVGGMLCL